MRTKKIVADWLLTVASTCGTIQKVIVTSQRKGGTVTELEELFIADNVAEGHIAILLNEYAKTYCYYFNLWRTEGGATVYRDLFWEGQSVVKGMLYVLSHFKGYPLTVSSFVTPVCFDTNEAYVNTKIAPRGSVSGDPAYMGSNRSVSKLASYRKFHKKLSSM